MRAERTDPWCPRKPGRSERRVGGFYGLTYKSHASTIVMGIPPRGMKEFHRRRRHIAAIRMPAEESATTLHVTNGRNTIEIGQYAGLERHSS